MSTIKLRCKSCDGILEIDEEREVMFCPYCGSKEIFEESDAVKKERIRARAEKEIRFKEKDTEKEIEQEKEKTKRMELLIPILCFFLVAVFGLIGVLISR